MIQLERANPAASAVVWSWFPSELAPAGHISLLIGTVYLSHGPLFFHAKPPRHVSGAGLHWLAGHSAFEDRRKYGPPEQIVIPREQVSIQRMMEFAAAALASTPRSLPVLGCDGRLTPQSLFHELANGRRGRPLNCVTVTAECLAAGLAYGSPEKSRRLRRESTPLGLAQAIEEVFGVPKPGGV